MNNVLALPFVFRGALDVRARDQREMQIAAARALASLAKENVPPQVLRAYGVGSLWFGPKYILPKPLDPRVVLRVAPAVVRAAMATDVARAAVDLEDDHFVSHKLYPNVDCYSGIIYQAMGFPIEMFTVLFAIPRTAGWLAHWQEMIEQDSKIYRPRQIWTGADERDYVPLDARG